jgi:glycerophosphoryl diester phosphodiesterase
VDLAEKLKPGCFLSTGHRGARGLAPENTLLGFRCGQSHNVDIIEFDVQATRDGEIVVIHDPTVDRTTEGQGAVADKTLAELQTLDAGYRFTSDDGKSFPFRGKGAQIPLLSEVLQEFPELLFTIELKESPHPDFIQNVAAVVREHAADRSILASFEHRLLRAIRKTAPELTTSFSGSEIRNYYVLAKLGLAGLLFTSPAMVIQMPLFSDHDNDRGLRLLTPRFLRALHKSGRHVQLWTINDPKQMRELIDMGVDGITTDRPDLLAEVLS